MSKLMEVSKALAAGKAASHDDATPEFWKILLESKTAMETLLELCKACWVEKEIHEQWRIASVVLFFKKGDAALPANYRPISLLPVGYKVLARMLQKRLQN